MRLPVALILSSMLAVSCASKNDVAGLEKRLGDLEQQNSQSAEEIRANQKRLEATLAEIQTKVLVDIETKQKRLDENQTTMLRNSADGKEDHNTINNRLNNIGGSIDEAIHRLKQEEERLTKLDSRLRETQGAMMESFMANSQKIETQRNQINEQIASLSARIGEQMAAVSARIEELKQASAKAGDGKKKKKEKEKPQKKADEEAEPQSEAEPAAKTGKQSKFPTSPDELYNAAYDDFLNGSFSKAQAKFSEFIKRYPNSELSYNSQYWIGEALANQGKLKEAVEAFKLTAANYPKSTKAPAALWRAAELTEKTGSAEDLRAILRKIHDNYPASMEAVMADDKLKKLDVQEKQE